MSTLIAKRKATRQRKGKSTRINIRVHAEIKRLLVRAAKNQHIELSEFMLRSSQAAAEIELADHTRFVLPTDKWLEFNKLLDAPPRDLPGLRKLLSEPSVFETT